jgi:hypothetical protein
MKRLIIVVAILSLFATLGSEVQRVAPFTGPLAQINILSPAGGEWKRGTTMPITFTFSSATQGWVKISVKKGADTFYSFPHIAAAATPVKTTFNWAIPNDALLGGNYTVEIVSEAATAIHKSSNPFAIINLTPSVTPLGTGGPRAVVKPNMDMVLKKIINVTSPSTGDRWVIPSDEPIAVQWDTPAFLKVTSVNIKLLRGDGTLVKPLAAAIPFSAGSFSWKPTWSGITPGEYRIQVTDAAAVDIQGTGDPFHFDAQTIAFTSPAVNATLIRGKKYIFSWTYNGSAKQTIKINQGPASRGLLAENVPINAGNSGPGKGTLEAMLPTSDRTIHLKTTGSSIDSASVQVNAVAPSLAITAPAGQDSWKNDSDICTVAWNYNGNPDDIMSIYQDFNGNWDDGQGNTVKDKLLGKTTAGTGSFQFSKKELNYDMVTYIRIETPYRSERTLFHMHLN